MFIRVKRNSGHEYLQLVDSQRIAGKVHQRVIGTLGRRDLLERGETLDGLMASLGKFARHSAVATELAGMTWMATLFLASVCLLATDLLTGFGLLLPRLAPRLRGWALLAGVGLSALALVQGLRSPVVQSYEVAVPGLPVELDGTVLVAMSDLHLGSLLGDRWLAERVSQVQGRGPRPNPVRSSGWHGETQ